MLLKTQDVSGPGLYMARNLTIVQPSEPADVNLSDPQNHLNQVSGSLSETQQHSAEPTLWNTGLWAQHILRKSGAALASFTASVLVLTSGPAIAEQTIVR